MIAFMKRFLVVAFLLRKADATLQSLVRSQAWAAAILAHAAS
jgi:hypothetical protein